MQYTGAKSSPCNNITTIKILWNSVLSTEKAKFMILDIKDFYLIHDLDKYEYIFFLLDIILIEFQLAYNLDKIAVKVKYMQSLEMVYIKFHTLEELITNSSRPILNCTVMSHHSIHQVFGKTKK